MKTKDVLSYFGSYNAIAEALQIDQSAARHWGEDVPSLRQFQIQVLTNGALIADTGIVDFHKTPASSVTP